MEASQESYGKSKALIVTSWEWSLLISYLTTPYCQKTWLTYKLWIRWCWGNMRVIWTWAWMNYMKLCEVMKEIVHEPVWWIVEDDIVAVYRLLSKYWCHSVTFGILHIFNSDIHLQLFRELQWEWFWMSCLFPGKQKDVGSYQSTGEFYLFLNNLLLWHLNWSFGRWIAMIKCFIVIGCILKVPVSAKNFLS